MINDIMMKEIIVELELELDVLFEAAVKVN